MQTKKSSWNVEIENTHQKLVQFFLLLISDLKSGNIPYYSLCKKLIKRCKNESHFLMGRPMGLLMKTYVLFIYNTHININCMEYIVIVIPIFAQESCQFMCPRILKEHLPRFRAGLAAIYVAQIFRNKCCNALATIWKTYVVMESICFQYLFPGKQGKGSKSNLTIILM